MSIGVRVRKAADQRPRKTSLFHALTSDDILTSANTWFCHQCRDCPTSSEVWLFRSNWKTEREQIVTDLMGCTYRFSLLTRTRNKDGEIVHLWSARDALVVMALALVGQTINDFLRKTFRLYKQERRAARRQKVGRQQADGASRLEMYVNCRHGWVRAGLRGTPANGAHAFTLALTGCSDAVGRLLQDPGQYRSHLKCDISCTNVY